MFELFEHTADLGLRVRGGTLEELLGESAKGLLAMLIANPEAVQPVKQRLIELSAVEPSYLLFDWLNELLFAFESEKLLFCEFELCLHGDRFAATCRGEPMDAERHQMEHEVKAITYHGLRVEQKDGSWEAELIVDI